MRLAILELRATWGEPARALDEIEARLRAGAATDLVLLPEASLSGYVSADGEFDLAPFAEAIDGVTATRCAAIARAHATHLVAPLVLRGPDGIYNAMTCFDPNGELVFVYRKRHPWFPETWATAGREPYPLVMIGDCAFSIAVCYDVHFLAAEAVRELEAADVLLFPSAWVEEPDFRVARLSRLARQFGLHIANANWAPGVVDVPGQGGSCVVGPDGTVLARAPLAGRIDFDQI